MSTWARSSKMTNTVTSNWPCGYICRCLDTTEYVPRDCMSKGCLFRWVLIMMALLNSSIRIETSRCVSSKWCPPLNLTENKFRLVLTNAVTEWWSLGHAGLGIICTLQKFVNVSPSSIYVKSVTGITTSTMNKRISRFSRLFLTLSDSPHSS